MRRQGVALGQTATTEHDESLYLILRTLRLPLDSGPEVLDRPLSETEIARLQETFRRRIQERVPAAYLTQEAWLGPYRFFVDERAIIPRSYFLEAIPGALADCLTEEGISVRRAADICTGSGCLAILLVRQFPQAQVDACDVSAKALEVATINVRRHRLTRRIQLHRGDLLRALPPGKYDLIVCNPPYEPSDLVDAQSPEFAAEPRMAHDGGPDGLKLIRRLLRQARTRLNPNGLIALEVGGLQPAIDREFAGLQPRWLPTADGADCICVIRAADFRAGNSRKNAQTAQE